MPDGSHSAEWSIDIDRERCIGSGVCVMYAPDVLTQDADGKAMRRGDVTGDLDTIQIAIEGCPTGALALTPRHVQR